jgi:FkbM family methyltransferase
LQRRGFDVVRYPVPSPEQRHLVALFAGLEIGCVFDVGAHVGHYGAMLRQFGYDGRIVSFEPVAANAEALRQRGDASWTIVEAAVGNETGRRRIRLAGGDQQHSFLSPSEYGSRLLSDQIATVGEAEVDVVRIDDVFADYARPGEQVFLKVDTQGWDSEVLRGAERSLESIAALQFELTLQPTYEGQPDYLELLAWVRERGFAPTGIFPFFSDPNLLLVEADCVCRRRP